MFVLDMRQYQNQNDLGSPIEGTKASNCRPGGKCKHFIIIPFVVSAQS
jgi:hypothetical protein